MNFQKATRKPFPVKVVQVTLQNIEEVAEWCGGTIVQVPTRMLGTTTDLPVIQLKGQADNRGKDPEASLGCWIVELNGNFRSYKPSKFVASFDIIAEEEVDGETPEFTIHDEVELPTGDPESFLKIV